MSALPRKTLEELLALYTFEPSLVDVYTEGETDAALLRWFLRASSKTGTEIGVYPIDEIDVPGDLVRKYGLHVNNRGEVLTLCSEIEGELGPDFERVTGVVDSDLSQFLGTETVSGLVAKTDYCCMEMYFFNEECLDKLTTIAFQKTGLSGRLVIEKCAPILEELFLVRLAVAVLNLNLKSVDFCRFVSAKKNNLVFNREVYLRHYLSHNNEMSRLKELQAELERLRPDLTGDPRNQINGHDFLALLSVVLRSVYGRGEDLERCRPTALFFSLCCCVERSVFAKYPMFSGVLDRVGLA